MPLVSNLPLTLQLFVIRTASVVYQEFLTTDPEVRVRFPTLHDSLRSGGSGTGSTQPREDNRGATWKKQ
jgi:hypothetical protein